MYGAYQYIGIRGTKIRVMTVIQILLPGWAKDMVSDRVKRPHPQKHEIYSKLQENYIGKLLFSVWDFSVNNGTLTKTHEIIWKLPETATDIL